MVIINSSSTFHHRQTFLGEDRISRLTDFESLSEKYGAKVSYNGDGDDDDYLHDDDFLHDDDYLHDGDYLHDANYLHDDNYGS